MNRKRGFKGIVIAVSLVGAVIGFHCGIEIDLYFGWKFFTHPFTSLICPVICAVVGYYAIYRLILGITALVCDKVSKKHNNPRVEQKKISKSSGNW